MKRILFALCVPVFAATPYVTVEADITKSVGSGSPSVKHFHAVKAIAVYDTNGNGLIDSPWRKVFNPNTPFPDGNRIGTQGDAVEKFCGDILIYAEAAAQPDDGDADYLWFALPDPRRTPKPAGCTIKLDFSEANTVWGGDDSYAQVSARYPQFSGYSYTRFGWTKPSSMGPGVFASVDWKGTSWPAPESGFMVGTNAGTVRIDNLVIDVPLVAEETWVGAYLAATSPRAPQTLLPPNSFRAWPSNAATLWTSVLSDHPTMPPPDVWESIHYADINGDGRDDLCFRGALRNPDGTIAGSGLICALAKSGTLGGDTPADFFGEPQLWSSSFGQELSSSESYWGTLQFADLNYDKKADVCARYPDGMHCALSNGTSFGPAKLWTAYFSDAQGWNATSSYWKTITILGSYVTGLGGICGRGAAGIYCGTISSSILNGDPTAESFNVFLASTSFSDAEGYRDNPIYASTFRFVHLSGKTNIVDACARGAAGIYCALGDYYGKFGPPSLWTPQFSDARGWNWEGYYATLKFADVNGDGLEDVCGRGSAGWWCALNLGTRFETDGHLVATEFGDWNGYNVYYKYKDMWLVDVNGDGSPDLCGRGTYGIYCSMNITETGGTLAFSSSMVWVQDFGDSANWQTSPAYWATIQPAHVIRPTFGARFCGRGYDGILCSLR